VDVLEDGTEIVMRYGEIEIDNIEIYNMSQLDTFKAALRWENNAEGKSSVTNCAIHSGHAWGVHITNSANVLLENNTIWNFRPIGVGVQGSSNINITGNVLGRVDVRPSFQSQTEVDKEAGFSICAYNWPDNCENISLTNNIAGGVAFAGFLAPAHRCGEELTQTVFRDNVAHSAKAAAGGEGAVITPERADSGQDDCFAGSWFSAYKTIVTGVNTFQVADRVEASHMTLIDCHFGAAVQVACANLYDVTEKNEMVMRDSYFYGASESPDCPEDGSFCEEVDKYGFMYGSHNSVGKTPHLPSTSPRPIHKLKAEACWGGEYYLENNTFIGFEKNESRAFGLNPYGSDMFPILFGKDNKFIDVDEESFGFFYDPPEAWANVKDCGDFPCSAPWNVLMLMQNTRFSGTRPLFAPSGGRDFQLIADNPGFAPYIPDCERLEENNMYICETVGLGHLVFESLDADNRDRAMQPIYSEMEGTQMSNKLNAFMDHIWDGFYTGQVRQSRFPAIVYLPRGAVYNMNMTGSPAKKMRFELRTARRGEGMTVRIAYPSAESRKILING
jgi:hypothetical protein